MLMKMKSNPWTGFTWTLTFAVFPTTSTIKESSTNPYGASSEEVMMLFLFNSINFAVNTLLIEVSTPLPAFLPIKSISAVSLSVFATNWAASTTLPRFNTKLSSAPYVVLSTTIRKPPENFSA